MRMQFVSCITTEYTSSLRVEQARFGWSDCECAYFFLNERQFTKSDIISLHHIKANFTMELCTKYCHGFLEVYLGPIKRKKQ